jgi:hypothetical protein
MHNPKLDALQRQRHQSHAERLFGKAAATPEIVPDAEPDVESEAESVSKPAEGEVERKSYCILRGRIEMLPSLELRNRQGQTRLIPWHYFGGASLDHPGELVLFFDGPEGSCQITLTGLGLDRELLEGVKAQKVSWIQELDDLTAASVARKDPAAPVVTGIWIKGGGREWTRGGAGR